MDKGGTNKKDPVFYHQMLWMNESRKKHAEKPFSKNFHRRISLIRTKSFKVTLKKRSRDKNRFQNSFSLMTWILNKLITRCCQVSNSQEFCWNYLGVPGEIPLKKDPFNPRIIVLAQFELSIFCLFLPKYNLFCKQLKKPDK